MRFNSVLYDQAFPKVTQEPSEAITETIRPVETTQREEPVKVDSKIEHKPEPVKEEVKEENGISGTDEPDNE